MPVGREADLVFVGQERGKEKPSRGKRSEPWSIELASQRAIAEEGEKRGALRWGVIPRTMLASSGEGWRRKKSESDRAQLERGGREISPFSPLSKGRREDRNLRIST